MAGWIGVDLDGTLAQYTVWEGPESIGPPVEKMLTRVKQWIADGSEVRIVTARVSIYDMTVPANELVQVARQAIQDWCVEHGLPRLPVTATKDYGMVELWDDRAIQVAKNTGEKVAAAWKAERDMLLDMTRSLDEHPEDYEGPCECQLCLSYADPE